MATKQVTLVHVDENYIDMELSSSSSNFFSYSITSPPHNREFEFQMSSSATKDKDSTTSPADDLFYKGKLLPLHLPPRLEMVQNLLENSKTTFEYLKSDSTLEDLRITPCTTNSNTPLESCNISPSESYRVSSEISPDEIPFGWSSNLVSDDLPKKSWPKKLKQMKQLLLGQKLKASRNYIKALFNKSGCSDKSCATDASNMGVPPEKKPKCKNCYTKIAKGKNPFEDFYEDKKKMISCAVIKSEMLEDDFSIHRKSFSGVVQRHCAIKSSSLLTSSSGSSSSSSSSSFSFSSAGYYDLQLFKRSISANYELEGSIEGAIAHCKESQKNCSSKTSSDDNRTFSQFGTKIPIVGNQEIATLASTIV